MKWNAGLAWMGLLLFTLVGIGILMVGSALALTISSYGVF